MATFALPRDGTLSLRRPDRDRPGGHLLGRRDGTHVYASNAGSATLSGYRDAAPASPDRARATPRPTPGTVDAAAHVERPVPVRADRATGGVDGFRIGADGALTAVGSVLVPGAAGGEGIVAS